MTSVGRWTIERRRATASEIHGAEPSDWSRPRVWIIDVVRPALVLGSAQAGHRARILERLDRSGLDLEVVVRRSGGGAVYLAPSTQVWIDVFVPTGDQLWCADVARAFDWLGEVWVDTVLAVVPDVAPPEIEVHSGPFVASAWSDDVCFAGLGPGEVRIAGRKVIGISQRRTRDGSRFQSTALLAWNPVAWVDALVEHDGRRSMLDALDPIAGRLDADENAVITAFSGVITRR